MGDISSFGTLSHALTCDSSRGEVLRLPSFYQRLASRVYFYCLFQFAQLIVPYLCFSISVGRFLGNLGSTPTIDIEPEKSLFCRADKRGFYHVCCVHYRYHISDTKTNRYSLNEHIFCSQVSTMLFSAYAILDHADLSNNHIPIHFKK